MNTLDTPVLVLGATGTTGRRVAARLAARGVPVRAGSRTGRPPFAWDDPATWPAAVAGARAAYLAYHPDLVAPGAVDTVRRFAALAVEAGVRRLVLLSGRGEPAAQRAERAVLDTAAAAGAEAAVVRSAFFMQNFDEKDFADLVRAGTVALPAGPVAEPFVDADDVAAVAVAALTGDGHAGHVHEVTGPRLLTFADAVAEIATAVGRPVGYRQVTPAEFAVDLRGAGVPDELAAAVVDVFATVLDGRGSFLTSTVEAVLGRPPRDFTAYARAAAARGAWTAPVQASS